MRKREREKKKTQHQFADTKLNTMANFDLPFWQTLTFLFHQIKHLKFVNWNFNWPVQSRCAKSVLDYFAGQSQSWPCQCKNHALSKMGTRMPKVLRKKKKKGLIESVHDPTPSNLPMPLTACWISSAKNDSGTSSDTAKTATVARLATVGWGSERWFSAEKAIYFNVSIKFVLGFFFI